MDYGTCHIAIAIECNLRTLVGDPVNGLPAQVDMGTVDDVAQLFERAYRRFEELRPALTPERLNALVRLRPAGFAVTEAETADCPIWTVTISAFYGI